MRPRGRELGGGRANDPAQAKLEAGLCIVRTDGKDTAGVATLQQV